MTSSSRSRVPGQASEEAARAARERYWLCGRKVEDALAAAHDPALGLDRSVCLRDVVDALGHEVLNNRDWEFDLRMDSLSNPGGRKYKGWAAAIDHLIRSFTARSSSSPEGGSSE